MLQTTIMKIQWSLISLCAIGTVVVVGIFDEMNTDANNDDEENSDEENNDKNINNPEDESIMDIYIKMKKEQQRYNERYEKFSNNLDISEREYYNYKTINNRSLPIPIPYTKK